MNCSFMQKPFIEYSDRDYGKANVAIFNIAVFIQFNPPGGVLDIFLGGEVRHGPSYPDPV